MKSIWLIKNDLRLLDNLALMKAVSESRFVLPVFIFDTEYLQTNEVSAMHVQNQISALQHLRSSLQKKGSDIYVKTGYANLILNELHKIYPFECIYSHEQTYSSAQLRIEKKIVDWAILKKIKIKQYTQDGIIRSYAIGRDSASYKTSQHYLHRTFVPAMQNYKFPVSIENVVRSTVIPTCQSLGFDFAPSSVALTDEKKAHITLMNLISQKPLPVRSKLIRYQDIAHHLAYGTISYRTIYKQIENILNEKTQTGLALADKTTKTLLAIRNQLHWNLHYSQLFENNPSIEHSPLNKQFSGIPGHKYSKIAYLSFINGKTGYPLIDAGIRNLKATGSIHPKLKGYIIHFAIHKLKLNWRDIAFYLARQSVDYTPGVHWYFVQLHAGISDTKILRKYDVVQIMQELDPECDYIKLWVDELKKSSTKTIRNFLKQPIKYYQKPIIKTVKAKEITVPTLPELYKTNSPELSLFEN